MSKMIPVLLKKKTFEVEAFLNTSHFFFMILLQQRYFAAKTNQNNNSWNQKAVMLFGVVELGTWRNLNGAGAEGDSQVVLASTGITRRLGGRMSRGTRHEGQLLPPEKSLITGWDLLAK